MDRRHFFKTALFAPLLSPFFVSFKSTKKASHLYLITDSPQRYISLILQELQRHGLIDGHNFTLLNSFSFFEDLKRTLHQEGWKHVQPSFHTNICFSLSRLYQKADPSFTLVKSGKILDIRSKELASLWLQMNRNNNPSSFLTIVSFKEAKTSIRSGKHVSVYKDGRKVDTIFLKKKTLRSYTTERGKVSVRVEDGKAWVSESSCSHKICCLSPPVFIAGERIICAPNHFLLEIEGSAFIDTSIG